MALYRGEEDGLELLIEAEASARDTPWRNTHDLSLAGLSMFDASRLDAPIKHPAAAAIRSIAEAVHGLQPMPEGMESMAERDVEVRMALNYALALGD